MAVREYLFTQFLCGISEMSGANRLGHGAWDNNCADKPQPCDLWNASYRAPFGKRGTNWLWDKTSFAAGFLVLFLELSCGFLKPLTQKRSSSVERLLRVCRLDRILSPIFKPLGFTGWKMFPPRSVGLLKGDVLMRHRLQILALLFRGLRARAELSSPCFPPRMLRRWRSQSDSGLNGERDVRCMVCS